MVNKEEGSFIHELKYFFNIKKQNQEFHKIKKIIKIQQQFLKKKSKKIKNKDKHLLKEFVKHSKSEQIINKLSGLNSSQRKILENSFSLDFQKLREIIIKLEAILYEEESLSKQEFYNIINQKLEEENNILNQLEIILGDNKKLSSNLEKQIGFAKKLEHKDWFRILMYGGAKLITGKYNIVVEGHENIPKGAKILAPRHYHGDYDPSILIKALPENKLFFLGATDWMKEGIQNYIGKRIYELQGVIPVHRPDAIYINGKINKNKSLNQIIALLCLKQTVVIFPEAWPIKDSHYTPRYKEKGIGNIHNGVFKIAKIAKKIGKKSIPIIPIGLDYTNETKNTIIVNIGKPIMISSKNIEDEIPYLKEKLRKKISELSNV
ncbi:MAG: 1-acyl-sn-glycerol-3-phosphate acyltransferase [Nanobdellota archaeon]